MKTFAILLLVLLSAESCRGADAVANLKRDAALCAKAWDCADYPQFLGLLADPVIGDDKARDAALADIKDVFGYLNSLGLDTMKVSVDEPQSIRKTGSLYSSIVPVTAVMDGIEGRITAPSYVLAISRDHGATWKFIILWQRSDWQINALIPEFQGKFAIPTPQSPVIQYKKKPNQSPEPTAPSGRGSS